MFACLGAVHHTPVTPWRARRARTGARLSMADLFSASAWCLWNPAGNNCVRPAIRDDDMHEVPQHIPSGIAVRGGSSGDAQRMLTQ
eukprot:3189817-Alexandrium_andersonii.AAC.1